jgi:hypothetical protein
MVCVPVRSLDAKSLKLSAFNAQTCARRSTACCFIFSDSPPLRQKHSKSVLQFSREHLHSPKDGA